MSQERGAIAELAYYLWEARGKPDGSAEEDWLEAERQLSARGSKPASSAPDLDSALQDSFPASDPPASHLPDEPPSNADAQWKSARGRQRAAGPSAERREAPRTMPREP